MLPMHFSPCQTPFRESLRLNGCLMIAGSSSLVPHAGSRWTRVMHLASQGALDRTHGKL